MYILAPTGVHHWRWLGHRLLGFRWRVRRVLLVALPIQHQLLLEQCQHVLQPGMHVGSSDAHAHAPPNVGCSRPIAPLAAQHVTIPHLTAEQPTLTMVWGARRMRSPFSACGCCPPWRASARSALKEPRHRPLLPTHRIPSNCSEGKSERHSEVRTRDWDDLQPKCVFDTPAKERLATSKAPQHL